jgi:hypothetical protein
MTKNKELPIAMPVFLLKGLFIHLKTDDSQTFNNFMMALTCKIDNSFSV